MMSEWILCSEKLPAVEYDCFGNWSSEEVICLVNNEDFFYVCNGNFNPVGVFEGYDEDGIFSIGNPVQDVIAWIPFPKLKQEVE